jgi:peroxiredoxin
MKLLLLFSISIMFYFSFSTLSGKSNIELKVGDAAPLFSLKDQDKNTHKLSDYLGKKVVLYYFPKADTPG